MTSLTEETTRSGLLDEAASRRLGEQLQDLPRLAKLRAEGASLAQTLPMPNSRKERPWKYVDVSTLDLAAYQPAIGATWRGSEGEIRDRFRLRGAEGAVLAQHNGGTILATGAEGVEISDFAEPPPSASKAFERLGTAVAPGVSRLTALHYAFMRGGVLVDVAPNAEVAAPVRVSREYAEPGQLATPHTLIVTGANSRVTVIEEYASGEGEILALPAVEILPGPASVVRYVAIHRWGEGTRAFSEQHATTDRESGLWTLSLVTGGAVVKSHLVATLEGRGSSSEVLGLSLGGGHEFADFYTLQEHIGADTRSDLLIKSALEDHSQAVYYGLTRVGLEARNADANQENRNLLLSRFAKADSDPVLEILTNDVIRVSHGATAGPVDEEALFYLQSRGIDRAAAEDLLIWAFLGQVLDRVPSEELRDELNAALQAKLHGGAA